MPADRKLGQLLIERGLIDKGQLECAVERQKAEGGRIGSILVSMKAINEEDLLSFLSVYFDLPRINLRDVSIGREALRAVPAGKAKELGVMPMKILEDAGGRRTLMLAMIDPADRQILEELETFIEMKIEAYVTSYGGFLDAFNRYYHEVDVAPQGYENVPTRQLILALLDILIEEGVISAEKLRSRIDKFNGS